MWELLWPLQAQLCPGCVQTPIPVLHLHPSMEVGPCFPLSSLSPPHWRSHPQLHNQEPALGRARKLDIHITCQAPSNRDYYYEVIRVC